LKNRRLTEIIKRLEDHFGSNARKSARRKKNLLDVLIAVKLSQNTTDRTSHKAYLNLKRRFGKWEDLINAPLQEIKKEIKVCGMAETKSRDIKAMLREMKKNYGKLTLNHLRRLSDEDIYEELLRYKGIGTKTIACLIAFGLERPAFPVDTHVHRVMNRMGIVNTATPEKTFDVSKELIPVESKTTFHLNLIKFGRSVCKAPVPLCGECCVYDLCNFGQKQYYKDRIKGKIKENNFIILENI